MTIEQQDDGKKGEFFILESNKKVGNLVYVYAGADKLIIEHTEVDPSQEGKGLGRQLVNAAVDFARKNHIKILPLCPYAKRVMEGSEIYKDVLF